MNRPKKYKSSACSASVTATPHNIDGNVRPSSVDLKRAPYKSKFKSNKKRKLFSPSKQEELVAEIQDLIPTILKKLDTEGLKSNFCSLLRLISDGKFPLQNIAFHLLLDVAKWYSIDNTSKMFYSEKCIKFWKVMYRLFHGKVLRFMSGLKSSGQIISNFATKGLFNPTDTSINFAVPSTNALNKCDVIKTEIPTEIQPGIIHQALDLKSSQEDTSFVLSVDGKKVAPGLTDKHGDQNLFGHEGGVTLNASKSRLEGELSEIGLLENQWILYDDTQKIDKIKFIIKIVSYRIKDLRILFLSQTMALKKFFKEAGDDWRTSRLVYAISSVQATIYQIKAIVKRLLQINNSLLHQATAINKTENSFKLGKSVDAFAQSNWVSLKDPEELPEQFTERMRFVKQRSEQWFEKRKEFMLTGSKLFEGVGLDSLKNLQKHYDKVVGKKIVDEQFTEEALKRMDHGTKSEIHAIATLTAKILPVYFPQLKYIEEGAHIVNKTDVDEPFILVSPDGSLGNIDLHNKEYELPIPVIGCEFKCPCPADYKVPVHYDIPAR